MGGTHIYNRQSLLLVFFKKKKRCKTHFEWRIVNFRKLIDFWTPICGKTLPDFSKSRPRTHFQILHGDRYSLYLSKNFKSVVFLLCRRLWTLHKASKKRQLLVPPNSAIYFEKPNFFLHHSIDKKWIFLYVQFGIWLSISFTKKICVQEKVALSWGEGPSSFQIAEFKYIQVKATPTLPHTSSLSSSMLFLSPFR
jgi:hypothetical protein